MEIRHGVEQVIGDGLGRMVLKERRLLRNDFGEDIGMSGDEERGPSGGDAAGVLSCEEERNEETSDLFVGDESAIFVTNILEYGENIGAV